MQRINNILKKIQQEGTEMKDNIKALINNILKKIQQEDTEMKDNTKALEEKLDTISRNVDFANSRLVFLERIVRTLLRVDDMPISQGWRRLLHEAGGRMLEFVDIVCRDHNIPYWLYAGSLIGAKLYGHSVQWDDDWDIGMLRCDFERFRNICLRLFEDCNIIKPTFLGFSIQFRHAKFPVYGDVFPFDSYYEDVNTPEQMVHLEEKLKDAKKETPFSLWHWQERLDTRSMKLVSDADYIETKRLYRELIMENKMPCERGTLLENPLIPSTKLNNIYKYDWIFPLGKCRYEGVNVSCPHDVDAVLAQKFGDIRDLPPNLSNHRTDIKASFIDEMKKFIEQDMHELYEKIKEVAGYDKDKLM